MIEVLIKNETGLHARPAATFCMAAKKYDGDVHVIKDGNAFNAKSVISIMTANINCGDLIGVQASDKKAEVELSDLIKTLKD